MINICIVVRRDCRSCFSELIKTNCCLFHRIAVALGVVLILYVVNTLCFRRQVKCHVWKYSTDISMYPTLVICYLLYLKVLFAQLLSIHFGFLHECLYTSNQNKRVRTGLMCLNLKNSCVLTTLK